MGVATLPREARGLPLFYQLHKTAPLLTITLCHYEANSQLATHTQPQVQKPSAYWSLHFNPKKKKKKYFLTCMTAIDVAKPGLTSVPSSSGNGIWYCGWMTTTTPAVSPACVTYSSCWIFIVIVRPAGRCKQITAYTYTCTSILSFPTKLLSVGLR